MQNLRKFISPVVLPTFSRRTLFVLFWSAAGLAACTGAFRPGAASEAEYHVTSNRPSAQVTVSNVDDSAIVEVYSDNGIGSTSANLVNGAWPESITIRFHLEGLESLQFSYNETVVDLSVTTQNMILQSVSAGGAAKEIIDEESAFWMPVSFVDRAGTAVDSPTAGGVIEVGAPADFLAGDYTEFTINWIDFYR